MHEFSIIQSVFDILEKSAKEQRITRIDKVVLQVGRLRQIMPDFMQAAFEVASEGTIAEGAALEIIDVPIRMRCQSCGKDFEVERNTYICPYCDATGVQLLSGKEVFIERIEGEIDDGN